MTARSGIGDAPKRREDLRFLTGEGRYLDDLAFDGLTHAIVLRSPHAHARIAAIDIEAARAVPGVLAVLTAADATADGLKPLLPYVEANTQTGDPIPAGPAANGGRGARGVIGSFSVLGSKRHHRDRGVRHRAEVCRRQADERPDVRREGRHQTADVTDGPAIWSHACTRGKFFNTSASFM